MIQRAVHALPLERVARTLSRQPHIQARRQLGRANANDGITNHQQTLIALTNLVISLSLKFSRDNPPNVDTICRAIRHVEVVELLAICNSSRPILFSSAMDVIDLRFSYARTRLAAF
jgi:hypothetical protein